MRIRSLMLALAALAATAPAAAQAAFPGADGRIAFVRELSFEDGDVYSMAPNGQAVRPVLGQGSTVPQFLQTPSYAPGGRRIAASGFCDGPCDQIVVADADGGHARVVVRSTRILGALCWSPDGQTLAFVDAGHLSLIRADGSSRRVLTHPGAGSTDDAPAWSPDGARIAFVRDGDVWTVKPDGSGLQNLTHSAAVDVAPEWLADGSELVFASGPSRDRQALWAIGPNGAGARRLTAAVGLVRRIAASPSGTYLAYDAGPDTDHADVYRVRFHADGPATSRTRLTRSRPGYLAYDPSWQPLP